MNQKKLPNNTTGTLKPRLLTLWKDIRTKEAYLAFFGFNGWLPLPEATYHPSSVNPFSPYLYQVFVAVAAAAVMAG
ncbi:MAG: hypothetical protein ACLP2Y_16450 [Limisphaerales bacterium]